MIANSKDRQNNGAKYNPSYTQTLNDSSCSCPSSWEQFVDTNKVSRSCISKDRQNNGQKEKQWSTKY